MAAFCIPKQLAEKLKSAATRGEINIADLFSMTSDARRAKFQEFTDEKTAKEINAGFEKAMISNQKTALKTWAENTFSPKQKTSAAYSDLFTKIDQLDDLGVLTPENQDAFLSDLVATKLGVSVTADEAKTIAALSDKLEAASQTPSEFGTPSLEYFKAKREMDNYLNSLTPDSQLHVATSTIARGTMLFSIKSPLLNISSNSVIGFTEAVGRRLTNKSFGGMNGDYAFQYVKFINQVYKETGYDLSRMMSLDTGRKTLGEANFNTQGTGAVRAIGQWYEDKIFKLTQGTPDVWFSSVHFADSANITSSKLAQAELKGADSQVIKDRALEILKDATKVTPETEQGQLVRNQAIADAEYATFTNKSVVADITLGIRKIFNLPAPDLSIGDNMIPFAKTPANALAAQLESSGVLLPVDVGIRMINTLKAIKEGDSFTEAQRKGFHDFQRTVVRAGLGLTFAYLISQLFKPDDFIGQYPVSQKERDLLTLKNATPNSVRMGNYWISLDYFDVIGGALIGMLYAKKYGTSLPDATFKYFQGVILQLTRIPGFTEANNALTAIQNSRPDATKSTKDNIGGVEKMIVDTLRSRIVPAIVYDVAQATDSVQRQVSSSDPLASLKNTIPGLRQTLPPKRNLFGDTQHTEGWNQVLFGSRFKTDNNSPLLQELDRLASTGDLPAITDVTKNSKRAKELQQQIGTQQFNQAIQKFSVWFKTDLTDLITSDDYQSATDDAEKRKMIDAVKAQDFNDMLDEYGYTPPVK